MSIRQHEYFDRRGPLFGIIAALAATDVSANVDTFTASASWTLDEEAKAGRKLRLYADGNDVYFAFSTAADVIDNTAVGAAAGKCQCIAKGTAVEVYVPRSGTGDSRVCAKYLCYKTSAALTATLRVSVCSQQLNT